MSSQTKQGKTDQWQKHECMERERNESLLDRQAGQGSTCPEVSWGPGELQVRSAAHLHPDASFSPRQPVSTPQDHRWLGPPPLGQTQRLPQALAIIPRPHPQQPLLPWARWSQWWAEWSAPPLSVSHRQEARALGLPGGGFPSPSLPLSKPPWPPGPFHSLAFPTVTGVSRKI